MAYLSRRKRGGAGLKEIASELGVSEWSLWRWARELKKRRGLVPVELTQPEESTGPTLVTPRGYRIEGLSDESLVRLVERLG